MTRVKICGVNSPAAFDAACDAEADWIGFVFFPASPRHVTPAQAAVLSNRRPGGPLRVGLFVDPTDAQIEATLAELRLDILQLYAPPDRAAGIASRFGLPIWRSLPIATHSDLPADAGPAGALVIEPRAPAGATRPGGNAVRLDVSLLQGWKPAFPWLLAGGLTPENVALAVAESGAEAVDVSSGVETAPGVKSAERITAFTLAARLGVVPSRAGN